MIPGVPGTVFKYITFTLRVIKVKFHVMAISASQTQLEIYISETRIYFLKCIILSMSYDKIKSALEGRDTLHMASFHHLFINLFSEMRFIPMLNCRRYQLEQDISVTMLYTLTEVKVLLSTMVYEEGHTNSVHFTVTISNSDLGYFVKRQWPWWPSYNLSPGIVHTTSPPLSSIM